MSEPKNGWKKWSDQEEAFILSLIKEGLSLAEIAARIPFRSKSAVYNRIPQERHCTWHGGKRLTSDVEMPQNLARFA